jgi:hypothetical protein
MINRLEMILYKLIFWGMIPLILFLLGWWSSIGLNDNQEIFSIALAGMGFGILIDVFVLKPWLKSLETLSSGILISVYVFYSIMILGFFMGVPVFNIGLGILGGRFMARVGLYQGLTETRMDKLIHSTARITTIILFGICLISAWIALKDPVDTAINLQGMFQLGFTVTESMVFGLVGFGGLLLLILQYFLTVKFAKYELKHVYFDPHDPFYRPVS